MTEQETNRPRSRLAVLVAVLAVGVAVLAAGSGLGARFDLWHYRTGFRLLRWAVYGAIGLSVLSLLTLFVTRPGSRRRGLVLALAGLLIGLGVVGTALRWRARGTGIPPIHDITTDTDTPPPFVAIAPLRADAPNPAEYDGPEVAAQQRAAYPDIRPLVLDVTPAEAFERARTAAEAMGWEVVAAEPDEGRIEAVATTFWFGFRDDVVVRIRPEGTGSRIDVRSKSRVGRSDVGTNARRIRAFLERLTAGAV